MIGGMSACIFTWGFDRIVNTMLISVLDRTHDLSFLRRVSLCIALTLNAVRHVWVTLKTVARYIGPNGWNRHARDSQNVAHSMRKLNKRNTMCSLLEQPNHLVKVYCTPH